MYIYQKQWLYNSKDKLHDPKFSSVGLEDLNILKFIWALKTMAMTTYQTTVNYISKFFKLKNLEFTNIQIC